MVVRILEFQRLKDLARDNTSDQSFRFLDCDPLGYQAIEGRLGFRWFVSGQLTFDNLKNEPSEFLILFHLPYTPMHFFGSQQAAIASPV